MMHKATNIEHYSFSSTDKLLLDTNIWIYIYGQNSPTCHEVNVYSQAFSNMIAAKSNIYIDVLIVSEFINRYARTRWEIDTKIQPGNNRPKKSYKDFRNSPNFKLAANEIVSIIKKILKDSSRIECNFNELEVDNLLTEFAAGGFDFNDQILTTLCKTHDLQLVTNDSDFNKFDIPILTSNKKLLKAKH